MWSFKKQIFEENNIKSKKLCLVSLEYKNNNIKKKLCFHLQDSYINHVFMLKFFFFYLSIIYICMHACIYTNKFSIEYCRWCKKENKIKFIIMLAMFQKQMLSMICKLSSRYLYFYILFILSFFFFHFIILYHHVT